MDMDTHFATATASSVARTSRSGVGQRPATRHSGISLWLLVLLGTLFSSLWANVAQAGIILGDSVDVAVHAPTRNEVCFLCGGVTSVNVEDGSGDVVEPYLAGGGWFEVDINSDTIAITFNRNIEWQEGEFIGLVISDINWLEGAVRAIPGALLVASNGNDLLPALSEQFNARLQHSDSAVALNWQGTSISAGTRFDIALRAPMAESPADAVTVPEPGALLLLLGVLALLGARQIAKRRNTAYGYRLTE